MKRTSSPLRTGSIASLFLKAAKKKASSASPSPAVDLVEEQIEDVVEDPIEESMEEDVTEEILSPTPPFAPPPFAPALPVYDINRLPQDPGERLPIADYPVNDQDAVRRAYILKGPHQNYLHAFKGRLIGERVRQFSPFWFHQHHWLEYSPKKEAAFCFVCYLFKEKKTSGKGTNAFTEGGWSNWNKSDALKKHVGGVTSVHNAAQEKYNLFVNPRAAVDDLLVKVNSEELRLYKIRLKYSLRCLKFLLHQGLAFRGHDESEESGNRGNFVELLKLLAANSEEVNKFVLKNAPGNCTLISHGIQTDIIQCCALETRRLITEELGNDHYAILADESSDVSHKEQLALCLRFVDKLDNRFDEINMELLSCMAALSPANSFAAFDAHKVRRLAEFYPDDFSSQDLIYLELQLDNYIDDMRKDENFHGIENLVDLSVKLVETRRHIVHNLVYLLLKLVLILPVATANVERAFSAMNLVKNKLRNKMGDSLLDDCLVTYIERDTFSKVHEEDIIETFMAMRRRKPIKK